MKILSINVARPRPLPGREKIFSSIFKTPVVGKVKLARHNLEGDEQADLSVHGGPDKAVYVYSFDNYRFWEKELGRHDFEYGQFGENLTVEGMTDDQVHVGDVFKVGSATVQVSQPRTPCFKLGIKMGRPDFPKKFMAALRPGFYLRVLEEGEIEAGDRFRILHFDPARLTVLAAFRKGIGS